MTEKDKRETGSIFEGTQEYYAKYRPGVPSEVIDIIDKHFNLQLSDRVLDLGCGTGQVALAMDGKCGEIVCMDSDVEMLEQARIATSSCVTDITFINKGSEDLRKIREKLGTFALVTICRAFHWMDPDQVLADLYPIIDDKGGVAIFGDGSFWTGSEDWHKAVTKVVKVFLGKERKAGSRLFKDSDKPWIDIVRSSAFKSVNEMEVSIGRTWNIDTIIGWLKTSSFANEHVLGKRYREFENRIRDELMSINSEGAFEETATFSIIMAFK